MMQPLGLGQIRTRGRHVRHRGRKRRFWWNGHRGKSFAGDVLPLRHEAPAEWPGCLRIPGLYAEARWSPLGHAEIAVLVVLGQKHVVLTQVYDPGEVGIEADLGPATNCRGAAMPPVDSRQMSREPIPRRWRRFAEALPQTAGRRLRY